MVCGVECGVCGVECGVCCSGRQGRSDLWARHLCDLWARQLSEARLLCDLWASRLSLSLKAYTSVFSLSLSLKGYTSVFRQRCLLSLSSGRVLSLYSGAIEALLTHY